MSYSHFTQRNAPYVSLELQAKLRTTRVLIAGCGIGSTVAETLVRLGCTQLTLADPDIVELHNLNRQAFRHADLGRLKVDALADRLTSIWPEANIERVPHAIDAQNARELVARVDLIIDTIDLVSVSGIVAVHDAARALQRPAVTALNIGFGAGAMVFPAGHPTSFRQAFGLPTTGTLEGAQYASFFAPVLAALAPHMDPRVVAAVAPVLALMAEGKPCPAPQVAIGAAAVAHLASYLVLQLVAGERVPAAPAFILYDPQRAIEAGIVALALPQDRG